MAVKPRRTGPSEQAWIDGRRAARMASVDAMQEGLRQCVYDYWLNVVKAFIDTGVTKPKHIRHLIETVLDEFSPTRGATSTQGIQRAPGVAGIEDG